MKKTLCLVLCFLMTVLCFAGCKSQSESLSETEIITIELASNKITKARTVAIVDEEDNILLENEDIDTAAVMYHTGENRYLELRFKKSGTKKFKEAINAGKVLSIAVDGEFLASPVKANEDVPEFAKLTGVYEDVANWYNSIT